MLHLLPSALAAGACGSLHLGGLLDHAHIARPGTPRASSCAKKAPSTAQPVAVQRMARKAEKDGRPVVFEPNGWHPRG